MIHLKCLTEVVKLTLLFSDVNNLSKEINNVQ